MKEELHIHLTIVSREAYKAIHRDGAAVDRISAPIYNGGVFAKYKLRRERNQKIAKLRAATATVYEGELKDASTSLGLQNAYEIASAQVQYEENNLTVMEQADLLANLDAAGIDVPEEFWNGEEWPFQRTLLPKGERWARRQLRAHKESRIEFYLKLVLPLASFVLALIALLRKNH